MSVDSGKTFFNANGTQSVAGKQAKLQLPLREPAKTADMVLGLAMNSLLSGSKLAEANYIAIFTPDKVKIFDTENTRINIDGEAVLQEW